MSSRRMGVAGALLVILGAVVVGAAVVVGSGSGAGRPDLPGGPGWFGDMMGAQQPAVDSGPQPGDTGFVAGTADTPRVVQIIAGPGYTFTPSAITVQRGETITFAVTTMGPLGHEFMVGPAAAVAADQEGTPEIADIGMMETKTLTYTFDSGGPYAFACHAPGHYEAGMRGTITVVG